MSDQAPHPGGESDAERQEILQRDVLLAVTAGLSLLNGMHFSPFFDPAFILIDSLLQLSRSGIAADLHTKHAVSNCLHCQCQKPRPAISSWKYQMRTCPNNRLHRDTDRS